MQDDVTRLTADQLKPLLLDQHWRLNNLYMVVDEHGRKTRFRMNPMQEKFWGDMWYLNTILKARQFGFSTFILIYMLDVCLFNSNIKAGVIAQTLEKVQEIFRDKIAGALSGLPPSIKQRIKPDRTIPGFTKIKDSAREISFTNGSSIRVDTSHRGGTLQYLHISEFGKISAKRPDAAKEIVTGALNTVHAGNFVFIESTAEGRDGYFYRYCEESKAAALAGKKLGTMDYKFHFYPWFDNPNYQLFEVTTIPARLCKYFDELEAELGITLTEAQKAWYAKKEITQGEDMKREYPSTPEEAFFASVEGAYFKRQMAEARKDGRITRVPLVKGTNVETWWDIGRNDQTAIWFTQTVGREIRVVHYYSNSGEGLAHYAQYCKDYAENNGIRYDSHNGPHDLEVTEWGANKSRWETALEHGLRFNVIPRTPAKADSIEAARNILGYCLFDEVECEKGIDALDNYRKEWDDKRGCYKDHPYHDWASDGADAFQTLAMGHKFAHQKQPRVARTVQTVSNAGWT